MSNRIDGAGVTRREAEVLALLGDQLTNAEIAERLFVSVRTVESHVSALLTKLGAANRRELGRIGARRPPRPPPLPRPATRFVGRASELAELEGLLDTRRVITLVGPPGVGKTRLAIELALRLAATSSPPTWFIDLAPMQPATVPEAVGDAVARTFGVVPRSGQTWLDAVAAAPGSNAAVVLLDNCEHVLAGAAMVAAGLVAASGDACVVATSREPLGLPSEAVYEVEPLPIPVPAEDRSVAELAAIPAVDLFVDRAAAASTAFALTETNASAVTTLCRRLDGLPLAIELAASRVRTFPTNELVAHLDQRFELLGRDAAAVERRHRTLREAIEWSYTSLDTDERALFDRLGVFPAGFRFDAAGAVAERDAGNIVRLLPSLVDKSLVVASGGESARRYRLLDSLRDFAVERLRQTGAYDQARAAHRDWYVTFAEDTLHRASELGQTGMLARCDEEYENLRAALSWCRERGDGVTGLRLAAALWRYWDVRGRYAEGRGWLDEFLELAPAASAEVRADAWRAFDVLATGAGDYRAAARAARQCVALARAIGDERRLGRALNGWGTSCWRRGQVDAAVAAWTEQLAVCHRSDQRLGVAVALNNLALVAREQGRYGDAEARLDESLAITRDTPGWSDYVAIAVFNLGQVDALRGEFGRAADSLAHALELWESSGNLHGIAKATAVAASIEAARGRHRATAELLDRSVAVARETGDRQRLAFARCGQGDAARFLGRRDEASARYDEALALFRTLGEPLGLAAALAGRAATDLDRGDHTSAQAEAAEAIDLYSSLGHRRGVAVTQQVLAAVARIEDDHDHAGDLLRRALGDLFELGCRPDLAPCLEDLADHALACGKAANAADATELLSAAAMLRRELGSPLPPARRPAIDELREVVRDRLGTDRFQQRADQTARTPIETIVERYLTPTPTR